MLRRPEDYLRLALGAALLVLLLKGLAYEAGGGAGLLSDAGESFLNLLTALLGLYGSLWARRPRDSDHPYGHGKADALLAAFQALLVGGTALFLAYTMMTGTYLPLRPDAIFAALPYEALAMLLNTVLALLLWHGGRHLHSHLLTTEAWHLMGDVTTSVLVLGGLGAVQVGLPTLIDKAVGLVLAGLMAYGAFRALRESSAALLDEQDPRLLNRLAEALEKHRRPEWIDIHNVRIQRYGATLHIDGHVTFPWYWSLQEAHAALKALEKTLAEELRRPVEFFWHMDPCEPPCCAHCQVTPCPHRQRPFEQSIPFRPETLFPNQKGPRG